MGPDTAKEICEGHLETTGRALLARDFEAFAACFDLPHTIETPDRKTVLKTLAALRSVFDRVCEDYQYRRVTDLMRFIEVAEFRGPNRIEVMYVTHMMSGSHRVVDPFPCYSVVERIGDSWLISASQYAVDESTTVGRALSRGGFENPAKPTKSPAPSGDPIKKEM